uniref:Uncharacterized protein n=1 Tax=viral metagenome TaxID=1070528 RepID=A0A6H1ZNV6_9ZZZZ
MAVPKTEPLFKLPEDMKKRMETANVDMDKAQKAIDTMKSLGMDVKEMQEKLDWAKQVRETLLKEFT